MFAFTHRHTSDQGGRITIPSQCRCLGRAVVLFRMAPLDNNAYMDCVACRKTLPRSAFDADRLSVWKRNRNVTRCAKCKKCFVKMPGRRSPARKQTWKQALYKCSVCKSALLPSKFHTEQLKQWEDTSTLYLARCGSCGTEMNTTAQTLSCNLCFATKPADAFSPARRRHRDSKTHRCKDCDFPQCSSCGSIPTMPKQTPYMCPVCLFPPCACGWPRPPWTQNRVTKKPTWQCKDCRV